MLGGNHGNRNFISTQTKIHGMRGEEGPVVAVGRSRDLRRRVGSNRKKSGGGERSLSFHNEMGGRRGIQ